MDALVEKYLPQIMLENTDYVPVNDAPSDAAYLLLNLPTAMLNEYAQMKNISKYPPDGAKFWKDTNLCTKLQQSGKKCAREHEPLADILEFLHGDVQGQYQKMHNPERIRLMITEVLEDISY